MHAQKSNPRPLHFQQAYQAVVLAFADNVTFTVAGFCKLFGHKPNRHTRATLNGLVQAGILCKHKRLYDDGHYRMTYYALKAGGIGGMK